MTKRKLSWRTCPVCRSRATKIFNLNTGKLQCQRCAHKYFPPRYPKTDMIKLRITRPTFADLELTSEEAKQLISIFIDQEIMKGMYINKEGQLENWIDTHGSGITEIHGKPSELQLAADKFLGLLK